MSLHCNAVVIFAICAGSFGLPDHKFPLDFDDTDFYLTSRKGGPPSAVVEDLRRGQEGILIKLRQIMDELSNDELKLNNIFYKLGHHDTELKSVGNGISRLTAASRKTETKLNKHAFNVEFLNGQLQELKQKLAEHEAHRALIQNLQNTVKHLEDRMSDALYNLGSADPWKNGLVRQQNLTKKSLLHQPSVISVSQLLLRDQEACPPRWTVIDGLCYYISSEKQNFKNSISSCVKMGGHLLSLKEFQKSSFTRSLNSGNQYWTSGTDIFSPNQWAFLMSGEQVPNSMWRDASKVHLLSRIGNNCAILGLLGLEAAKCAHRMLYICERM